jgi:hypothetical protein
MRGTFPARQGKFGWEYISGRQNAAQEELAMNKRKAFVLASGLLMALTVVHPVAHADEFDQATGLTFSQPIRIPGQILPAGTYWFVLIDHGLIPNAVQVFNSDRSRVLATLLTANAERLTPSDETTVTLAEPESAETSGEPASLMTWFYPGFTYGHQFIYSSHLEKTLEREHDVTVTVAADFSQSVLITEARGE